MVSYSRPKTTVWITADEAAHRLGVSKPTLYAYVSRGRIHRTLADDGRRSRFDAAEVAALGRGKPKPSSPGMTELRISSAITRIDESSLFYRGVPVASLIGSESFENVAELLWQGAPASWAPNREMVARLAAFSSACSSPRSGLGTRRTVHSISLNRPASASGSTMALEAKALAVESGHRPGLAASNLAQLVLEVGSVVEDSDSSRFSGFSRLSSVEPSAVLNQTAQLLGVLSAALPGVRATDQTIASRLWRHLARRAPGEGELALIEAALVALADHELATATLAVRISASTRADIYSSIAAGLCVLTGPLHGSASAGSYRLLASAAASGRPARAVDEALAEFGLLHGFGHKVYKQADPRSVALLELLKRAEVDRGKRSVVDAVLVEAKGRISRADNVDFALAAISFCCDLPPSAGELIFCFARIAGWAAHYLEELDEPPLRFRVRALYRGE